MRKRTFMVVVAAALLLPSVLYAQRTKTKIYDNVTLPQGEVTSPSVTVKGNSLDFEVDILLQPADVSDPTATIVGVIEGNYTANDWVFLLRSGWTGGFVNKLGNPVYPRWGYGISPEAPKIKKLRIRLDSSRDFLGCTATLTEAPRGNEPR